MLFVAHEYIARQAAKQIKGLNHKLIPPIIQGANFPDIKKLPMTRFYKGNTHFFSSENTIRCTPLAKAYSWGLQLHILADFLWHKGIYSPMKSPICVSVGNYDPIRERIMSHTEHMSREIALDLYISKISGDSKWGTGGKHSLKDFFNGRYRGSEFGFWCYKMLVTTYFRMVLPYTRVLLPKKVPRRLARSYQFITEEVTNCVDKMLETTITASVQALKEYISEKKKIVM